MESLATSSYVSSAQPWPLDPHKSDEQCVMRCSLVLTLKNLERLDFHLIEYLLLLAHLRLTKTYNNFSNSHDLSLSASSNPYLKALLLSQSHEWVLRRLRAERPIAQ